MPARSYEEFNNAAMALYQAQDYAAMLDLLTREGEQYPEEAPQVLYLRSCMAARVGRPDLALQLIQQALDRGFWYGERVLRDSPSWQPLQGLPAFEQLVTVCGERERAAAVGPLLFTEPPAEGCYTEAPCPLLIALHGNGSNARVTLPGWRPVVAAGWLLAVPQSSQIGAYDAYIWDDQATALREVADHHATLTAQQAVDLERVILAGFSMGGETALRAALDGTIPVRGFILLGPGGPTMDTPDAWLPLITGAAGRGLAGYVFLGARDNDIPQDAVRTLVALLDEHGIPCKLEQIPGIAHAYPRDFGPYLARALAFIEQRGGN